MELFHLFVYVSVINPIILIYVLWQLIIKHRRKHLNDLVVIVKDAKQHLVKMYVETTVNPLDSAVF
jgi:hypothetical protein